MGTALTIIVIILAIISIEFLIDAGLVALACWCLPMIGITHIGSWEVTFSWPLVIVVWVITAFLSAIFKSNVKVEK